MDVFDLMAKLMLDSSAYEAGLNGAKKKATSVGGVIGKGLKKVAKLTGVALAATTTAVTGFAAASVKAGSAFDTSMSQVAATMGVTVDEIRELRDYALEMGSKTAFSATQAADALNYMALAGYDAETSMKMLPNVLSLAAAGSIDLASASDMVTDAQSALGLSLEETETMVDQMAAAASKSNTSVAQLGEAFLTVGATARNLKGGTQELATVLGILADNGIKGAEGGTHVRNAILSLQTPTKDGTEALKKLGMSYADMYDEAGNMRSLPEIFQQISGAMEGMNQQQKDAIVSGLFNKTDLAAVNALLGTSADRWEELGGAIGDSAGAAEKMAATQLDNLSGDVTLFKSALEGAQIALSDELAPSLREFVQFGTEGLAKVTDAFKVGGIEGAMDALGEIITDAIGMITKKLPALMAAGKKILEAVGKGILQNLPQITSAAVNIAIQLAVGLIDAIPQIIEAMPEIFAAIVTAFQENWPAIKEAGAKLIEALLTAWQEKYAMLGEAVMQLVQVIKTALQSKWQEIVAAVTDKINTLKQNAINKWNEIKSNAIAIWGGIKTSISETVEGMKEAVREKLDALVEKVQTVIDKAKEKFEELKGKIKAISDAIRGFFNFNFSMPHIPVPHFTISPPGWTIGDLLHGIKPELSVSWYAKAMDNPYLFTKPTLMGFGDGNGGEMVYGHENLMNDIREATGSGSAEVEAKLDQMIELMEYIVRNGLNANIDRSQMYRAISDVNQKRSRATGYNSLAMA